MSKFVIVLCTGLYFSVANARDSQIPIPRLETALRKLSCLKIHLNHVEVNYISDTVMAIVEKEDKIKSEILGTENIVGHEVIRQCYIELRMVKQLAISTSFNKINNAYHVLIAKLDELKAEITKMLLNRCNLIPFPEVHSVEVNTILAGSNAPYLVMESQFIENVNTVMIDALSYFEYDKLYCDIDDIIKKKAEHEANTCE